MTRRRHLSALALLATVSACAQDVSTYRDRMGNLYPAACRRDLSRDAELMARVEIDHGDLGRIMQGMTLQFDHPVIILQANPTAYRGMTPVEVEADTLQHELCHALVGEWHRTRR